MEPLMKFCRWLDRNEGDFCVLAALSILALWVVALFVNDFLPVLFAFCFGLLAIVALMLVVQFICDRISENKQD